jgi:hypothetical protein
MLCSLLNELDEPLAGGLSALRAYLRTIDSELCLKPTMASLTQCVRAAQAQDMKSGVDGRTKCEQITFIASDTMQHEEHRR